MAAPPRHPLFALLINRLQFHARRGNSVLHTAGPAFLTHNIAAWRTSWGFGNVSVHTPFVDGAVMRPSILYPSPWNASENACGRGSAVELDRCAARMPAVFVNTFWTHTWKA